MKILVYGLNYSPELTGIGRYTGEMVEWLAQRGHDVHVVTAPPYYPAWKISGEYRNGYSREGGVDRPLVLRSPVYVPERPTGVKRVAHLASFMIGSLPLMVSQMWWQPDVVFTVEPTFFCAPVALLAALGTGAASWLHIQDFEVDAAFDLHILPREGTVHRTALALESLFSRRFHRISSISLNMVQRLWVKGIDPSNAILFPNWVDVNAIQSRSPRSRNGFRERLGLEHKVILLYSGNMGAKQGLESLAPLAASFANDEHVHFVFCGDGAFRPRLEQSVQGLGNVTMLPLQPHGKLDELLNSADIHLLPQRSGAADLVMPSKLTGMLASGRPIIATADRRTQVALVVEGISGEDPCGLVVPAEDDAALHRAVRTLVESEQARSSYGSAGRRYAVKHLGKEEVLLRFERELQLASLANASQGLHGPGRVD